MFNAEFTSSLWSGNLKAWSDQSWTVRSATSCGRRPRCCPPGTTRRVATQNTDRFGRAVPLGQPRHQSQAHRSSPKRTTQPACAASSYLRGDRDARDPDGRTSSATVTRFRRSATSCSRRRCSWAPRPPAIRIRSSRRHSMHLQAAPRPRAQGMVYIGGNDGMLHAFNATDGKRSCGPSFRRQAFQALKPLTEVDLPAQVSRSTAHRRSATCSGAVAGRPCWSPA